MTQTQQSQDESSYMDDWSFWHHNVGRFDAVLREHSDKYVNDVISMLLQKGIECTKGQVHNVRYGRVKRKREIAHAIGVVAQGYIDGAKVKAIA